MNPWIAVAVAAVIYRTRSALADRTAIDRTSYRWTPLWAIPADAIRDDLDIDVENCSHGRIPV